jgi:hypothetical protein
LGSRQKVICGEGVFDMVCGRSEVEGVSKKEKRKIRMERRDK